MSGHVETIQSIYAAFGRGDVAAILSQAADDVQWRVIGSSAYPLHKPFHGKAGGVEFFTTIAANEDFSEFAPISFHDAGDHVFVLGRAVYKMKNTGKGVATDFIHIWTLKDGKVASFREFSDTAQVVAAYAA